MPKIVRVRIVTDMKIVGKVNASAGNYLYYRFNKTSAGQY